MKINIATKIVRTWVNGLEVPLAVDMWLDFKRQHPKFRHAVFTQDSLQIGTKCFNNGKGKCFGCGYKSD